jgi:enamine deaminase RidA (YjgF/YER057c/UK114 family)
MNHRQTNPIGVAFSQTYEIKITKDLFLSATKYRKMRMQKFRFRAQAELAWKNLEMQLKAADMTLKNIVKFTVLDDPACNDHYH